MCINDHPNLQLSLIVILIVALFCAVACEGFDSKKERERAEERLINQIEHYSKTACIDGVTYVYSAGVHIFSLSAKFGTDSKIIQCKPKSQYPIAYE
jgi:hypothetical protein